MFDHFIKALFLDSPVHVNLPMFFERTRWKSRVLDSVGRGGLNLVFRHDSGVPTDLRGARNPNDDPLYRHASPGTPFGYGKEEERKGKEMMLGKTTD